MQIDDGLISYLESLSLLSLSDGEKGRLKGDFEKILGYMDRLNELDTAGIAERSHPFDDVNAFREDEAKQPFSRGLILRNAPESSGGMFVAPKTVE